jgi:hypothetical protein
MSLYQLGVTSILLISIIPSCKNDFEKKVEIDYLGNKYEIFESFSSFQDSIGKRDIKMEYDDSFSGHHQGVELYSFQQQKDSLLLLTKLFFDDSKLNGIIIDVTSRSILDSNLLLAKARKGFYRNYFSSNIATDTLSINVSPLESSSAKLFRIKFYNKGIKNYHLYFDCKDPHCQINS